jgi:hypothetical protein
VKIHYINDSRLHSHHFFTGIVYFQFDDVYFPEVGWNDKVFTLLSMWTSELQKLDSNGTCKFYFLDGPFHVAASRISNSTLEISLYDGDTIVNTLVVKHSLLHKQFLHFADEVVREYVREGFSINSTVEIMNYFTSKKKKLWRT